MEVHEKKPGDTKVKTLVLFCAAPSSTYADPDTYDNTDLSDIVLPSGNVIPIVSKAKYLGSMMSRDSTDDMDVDARITAASRAFGALSKCVFKSRKISLPAKRAAYVALVLSILLYGSECWCLTAALWRKLRTFHRSCTRAMCRINRWHTWKCKITAASVSQRLGLKSLETYVVKRQLQWAGHVARMGEHRLPRKLLPDCVVLQQQTTQGKARVHVRRGSRVRLELREGGPGLVDGAGPGERELAGHAQGDRHWRAGAGLTPTAGRTVRVHLPTTAITSTNRNR